MSALTADATGGVSPTPADKKQQQQQQQRKRRRTDVQLLADYVEEQRRHAAGEKVRITLMCCPGCNNVYTRAARHLCGGGGTAGGGRAAAASSASASSTATPLSPSDSQCSSSRSSSEAAGDEPPAKRQAKSVAVKPRRSKPLPQAPSSALADWKAAEQQDTLRWQWSSAMRAMEQICAQSAATFYLPNPETLAKCVTVTDELQQLNQQLWQAQSAREAATRRFFGASRLERAVQVSTSASGVGVRVQFREDEVATQKNAHPRKRAKQQQQQQQQPSTPASSDDEDDEDDGDYSAMSQSDGE
jgi:hypothetical protein